MKEKTIIVTGGAGFIGSNLIKYFMANSGYRIINLDKLTYAGSLQSLKNIEMNSRYKLEKVDICDINEVRRVFTEYNPDYIINLAAESHVDRSIDGPGTFIQTNIVGTYVLLDATMQYFKRLDEPKKKMFRFLHVSTDEVFGTLDKHSYFTEDTPYDP
ncbi:MAG: GDP-mannose 4,6-dehydratase, partial [Ignavibacterium sp.]